MIYYFVTAPHDYTVQNYLATWGSALRHRFRILHYEALPNLRELWTGTYIFSDLERLSPTGVAMASQVWEQLARAGSRVHLMNHPAQALRRLELLQTLFRSGANRFRAERASARGHAYRFPVFLRAEQEHDGSITDLLYDEHELEAARSLVQACGYRLRDVLVVEYCDTAGPDGLFRKYSAFRVADAVVPRHLIFSRNWVLKYPDLIDEERVREEGQYLEQNPHAVPLREVFARARIEYGRVDYGLQGGALQIWEINTNPAVMRAPDTYQRLHLPLQEYFAPRIRSAFEAVDRCGERPFRMPLSLDPDLLHHWAEERRMQRKMAAIHFMKRFRRACRGLPPGTLEKKVRRILGSVRPLLPHSARPEQPH